MQLLTIGTSGSLEGPDNAASGYVVTSSDGYHVLLDIGPGVLSRLQHFVNPSDCHVLLSHLHADHCMDFLSLLVWRRYHPHCKAHSRQIFVGPSFAQSHLGRAGADTPDELDDFSDTFEIHSWADLVEQQGTLNIGNLRITAILAIHPTESYCIRIEDTGTDEVLVYSGDTAYTDALVEFSMGADLLLCEATWGESNDETVPTMHHLSGEEAGQIAQQAGVGSMLLTHIPPWGDSIGAQRGALRYFTGSVELAQPEQFYQIGSTKIIKPSNQRP